MALRTIERDTETRIDRQLANLAWEDNTRSKRRTVWKQKPKTEKQYTALGGKRPDYILYPENSNNPIAVIEAKRQGVDISKAIDQGRFYAEKLGAPLVFATDGVFTKTVHTGCNEPLFLNEDEVDTLLEHHIALRYLKTNRVSTLDKQVLKSRGELIGIFSKANDLLREEGLQQGIERFSEFSNLLFLKIFSELDEIKKKQGHKTRIPEAMLWESFSEERGVKLLTYLNDTVISWFANEYGKDIFQKLNIRNPENLREIIELLSDLQLSDTHADIKGDAFEYFIRAYSASNPSDLGEIFTPRHVVKTMVKLIDPKIGETVYDPFCGTGGMLIVAFKHIMDSMARTERNLHTLTTQTLYGTELTKTAKISKMNMILAGDGHSNIKQADSFQNPIDQEHDVLITNYPFAQKTRYGDLYDIPSRNGDVISPQHCFRSLKDGGRMIFIAPEGFLFRQDRALRDVRKFLLNNANLKRIISLPQGCFLPYNGVKASILYFDEVRKAKTKKHFWFSDVKNDGFTLDKRRAKIDGGNDLETVLSERDFESADKGYLREKGIHKIDVEDVSENNYSFACKQLIRKEESIKSDWPMVELGEVCEINPSKKELKGMDKTCKVSFVPMENLSTNSFYFHAPKKKDLSEMSSSHVFFRDQDVLLARVTPCFENNKLGIAKNLTNAMGFGSSEFFVMRCNNRVLPKYIYFSLATKEFKRIGVENFTGTGGLRRIPKHFLTQYKIPLPPLEIQEEIVKELDGYQKIIDGCRQVVENYKPHIEIDPEWEMVELGEVCDILNGSTPRKDTTSYWENGDISWFTIDDLREQGHLIRKTKQKITKKALDETSVKIVPPHSTLLCCTASVGECAYTEIPLTTNQQFNGLIIKKEYTKLLIDKFLFWITTTLTNQLIHNSGSTSFNFISVKNLKKTKIPLPALEIQEEIVKKIEKEQEAVDRCKWLIETYTQKTQDRINALYS